ncbi:MAG: hypothetical protein IJO96_01360, partial [Oscillospiraceae bacterium]|nr:hypothetical protein [Oscillospiraceae bacterium]
HFPQRKVLAKSLALERYASHSILFYYIYVELRSNEEIPSSAEDGTCSVRAKGTRPFGIP